MSALRAIAAAVLVAVAGLVILAVAPRLAGFEGHVVVSGSMAPRVAIGDVVLTRQVSPQELQPGQVVLFADPEQPDRLVLHRLVSFDAQGRLVTRGDANQSNDSVPVPATSVIGTAQLRVPYVGLPAHWRLEGEWGHIALVAAVLGAATVFVVRTGGGAAPRGADGTEAGPRPARARHRAAPRQRSRSRHRADAPGRRWGLPVGAPV